MKNHIKKMQKATEAVKYGLFRKCKSKKWNMRRNRKAREIIFEIMCGYSFIPEGDYCYEIIDYIRCDENSLPRLKTKCCDYFYINDYGFGDCKLLKHTNGCDKYYDCCLDDSVKWCGINKFEDE